MKRTGPNGDRSIWIGRTPAKLNLFFEVLGKRADGFHEIESVALPIGLYDDLVFESTEDDEIRLDCFGGGNDVPTDQRNLVVQALQLLKRKSGVSLGARIRLIKRIPSRAGLGGGSSDASLALMMAARAWTKRMEIELADELLLEVAAEIGSDCPIFFHRRASISRGRGERSEPLNELPRLHFVLIKPNQGLSTAEVYRHCMETHDGRLRNAETFLAALRTGSPVEIGRQMFNRLETSARLIWPEWDELHRRFEKLGCTGVRMSGSGTAFFGLCRNARHARFVAGRLRQTLKEQEFVYSTVGV